jgi:hypothetical protein
MSKFRLTGSHKLIEAMLCNQTRLKSPVNELKQVQT